MTMAHKFRRDHLRDRARLERAAGGPWPTPQAKRELEAWERLSMSDALKRAWEAARNRAELRAMERATGPAADRLRAIETQIEQLDGRTRWQSSHYSEMADLRAQHSAAFQAVRDTLSLQGGQELPA
jgi:hypothetical protein